MGYDLKYGNVSTEHGEIPPDELVIVLRARDVQSVPTLSYYLMRCIKAGSPRRHLDLILNSIERFREWQDRNPDKVRVPDSERSRAWLDH